jgi:hypothetical protein
MANEPKWTVEIDDQTYQVECVTQTSLYDVYVDGELAIRVPRKLRNDDSDSEYDIRIGGKRCQIVVYDGVPDLSVDGILVGEEDLMRRMEIRNRWLKVLGGLLSIVSSSYATFLWVVFELAGKPIFGGVVSLIFIQIFFWGGVALIISAIRRKKKEY